ncbi:putative quinol monooxygenase [Pseudonocardia adelaidensis]|uniref:Antibiotic biosynthesis monooxygenase n=1 Tax=Pseudonocardia adelaidensis TaxID=648754 RepID=A0ABP9NKT6_9PSEU
MLIIAGWLRVDPSARTDYLDACAAVVAQARSAPGCLDFALTADLLDPGRIDVYERWESDEQLLAFRGSGPDDTQTERIRDADVRRYRISAVEPA